MTSFGSKQGSFGHDYCAFQFCVLLVLYIGYSDIWNFFFGGPHVHKIFLE
jgi:hypothetical protein